MTDIQIFPAQNSHDVAAVKALFLDYQAELGVDLCFQGFDEEMATFPAKYDRILLARDAGGHPVGAVGVWRLEPGVCEMKRLYVIPPMRSTGLGRQLCERILEEAKALGYAVMKLDTLARLKPAVALYQAFGFRQTKPYNVNPEADILYFERAL